MRDIPESGLARGQVGTVVDALDLETYEVEFVDNHGQTYGLLPIGSDDLMVLHHEPFHEAA